MLSDFKFLHTFTIKCTIHTKLITLTSIKALCSNESSRTLTVTGNMMTCCIVVAFTLLFAILACLNIPNE